MNRRLLLAALSVSTALLAACTGTGCRRRKLKKLASASSWCTPWNESSRMAARSASRESTVSFNPEPRKDLLGGVTVLKVSGLAAERSSVDGLLYQPLIAAQGQRRSVLLTFVPYYTVESRESKSMAVWVPVGP